MKRTIPTSALLFASVSAILGSGWLFAAFYTTQLAGPAAVLSWLIGGFAILVIAFVFAELAAMLPVPGSSTRIPHFTHGTIVSFMFAWLIWLSYVSLAPTEVQAIIQYLSFYLPKLLLSNDGLSGDGYMAAAALMLFISAINIFSLRWLIKCNSILTILKLFIPVFLSLVIILMYLSPHRVWHHPHFVFMPFGMSGVFAAIATGGIVFAFNGFKQACEMAGEAINPKRSLPIAVVGSIIICLLVYLLLQFAFLASLRHSNLLHGWGDLHLPKSRSPFAAIIHQNNMSWALSILYVGAIVGPFAAALMYAHSSSRSLFAQAKNGYIPKFFALLTPQGAPWVAIVANFFIGMLMFAPLPGWDRMVSFLTSLMAITYAIGPVCLVALRKQLPNYERPFKLPFATVWATVAFYFCTLLIYWTGWDIISKLSLCLIIGVIVLLTYHVSSERGRSIDFNWTESLWLWPYFIGISIISYLGSFGHGHGIIPFGWDFLVIALFCILIMSLAGHYKLPATETEAHLKNVEYLN